MARKNYRRRLKAPITAKKGEIITIKTMAEHTMEPGVRRDPETGLIYPRFIIDSVIVRYNGKQIFRSRWYSGVSENPYMSFKIKVEESGLLEVEWIDDYKQSTFKRSVVNVYDDEGNEIFPLRFNKASQLED